MTTAQSRSASKPTDWKVCSQLPVLDINCIWSSNKKRFKVFQVFKFFHQTISLNLHNTENQKPKTKQNPKKSYKTPKQNKNQNAAVKRPHVSFKLHKSYTNPAGRRSLLQKKKSWAECSVICHRCQTHKRQHNSNTTWTSSKQVRKRAKNKNQKQTTGGSVYLDTNRNKLFWAGTQNCLETSLKFNTRNKTFF